MGMGIALGPIILGVAALLVAGVLASRASSRIGVPALLLFLGIGMLAGSDGPGGIYFDNPPIAQALGVVALAFILFGGGLSTHWDEVRAVAWPAAALATAGVMATAGLTGWFASRVLGVSLLEGLLLGAIVSSTDAAAVFAVLRSRNVRLPDRLRSLLELESGSNDPMAVFLTIGVIGLLQNAQQPPQMLVVSFFLQMGIGGVSGYLLGRAGAIAINKARLEYEGLYPAITLALVLSAYGLTDLAGGNGFLAVYLAGIVLRRADFIHKRSLVRFHDALAWLMQIAMFLTLGLQVFPTKLLGVAAPGAGISLFLILVGRPLAVFALLPFWRFDRREQTLVAWVGLRGAAPIILATFPLVARVPAAETIFHMVFFIVLTSTLIQGSSIPLVARLLRLSVPDSRSGTDPLDLVATGDRELLDLRVPETAGVVGHRVLDLRLPQGTLLVLVERDADSFVPSGGTTLQGGDRLVVLTARASIPAIRTLLAPPTPAP